MYISVCVCNIISYKGFEFLLQTWLVFSLLSYSIILLISIYFVLLLVSFCTFLYSTKLQTVTWATYLLFCKMGKLFFVGWKFCGSKRGQYSTKDVAIQRNWFHQTMVRWRNRFHWTTVRWRNHHTGSDYIIVLFI